MNDDKVKIEPQIVENKQGIPTNPNLLETSKKVEEINETFKENLSRNPIKPTEGKDIIAYHEVETKKDEAVQADSVNEEVTLDLGDELEIEIEE